MANYTPKPIEAMQLTALSFADVVTFCGATDTDEDAVHIVIPPGREAADATDYVIKVGGVFHSMSERAFETLYDEVVVQ